MNYGFTQREREALRKHKRVSNEGILILAILILTIVLGFEFQVLVARAQTTEPIHQNDYYCGLIAKGEPVIGASSDDITKLCANLK